MIQVENVYEEILHQTLLEEALKGENILEVIGIPLQPVAHELFLQTSQSLHLAVPVPLSPTLMVTSLQCFFIWLIADLLRALKSDLWGSFTKSVELKSDGLAQAFF